MQCSLLYFLELLKKRLQLTVSKLALLESEAPVRHVVPELEPHGSRFTVTLLDRISHIVGRYHRLVSRSCFS